MLEQTTTELLLHTSVDTLPQVPETTLQSLGTVVETLPVQNMPLLGGFEQWAHTHLPALQGYSEFEMLGLGIIGLIWILTVFWTLRDAMARSESVIYPIISMLLVTLLSPVIGLPLYLAFRPLTYKWERGYRREALMETHVFCPHCQNLLNPAHNACVYCGETLKTECKECHHKYYRGYAYCSECGAPNLD